MPLPWAIHNLYQLNQRKKKRRMAGEGLDEMIANLMAKTGPAPSEAQAGAMNRQMDPMLQLLGGDQPAPQMSPISTGKLDQRTQDLVNRARAVQTGKGNIDAFDYLQQATDPATYNARMLELENLKQKQAASASVHARNAAHQQMLDSLGSGNMQGVPQNMQGILSNPTTLSALSAMSPNEAGGAYMDAISQHVRGTASASTVGDVQKLDNGNLGVIVKANDPLTGELTTTVRDLQVPYRENDVQDIGGVKFHRTPSGWVPLQAIVDQLDLMTVGADAEATGTASAAMWDELLKSRTARQTSLTNLNDIMTAIESGQLGTGMIEGRVALPSEMRETLFSEQMKAARSALRASGETKTTDADVDQMRQAMFGSARTEEFNVRILQQTIQMLESEERRFQALKRYREMKGLAMPALTEPRAPTREDVNRAAQGAR